MKRTSETDEEWSKKLDRRKRLAEMRMRREDSMRGFVTLKDIFTAASEWSTSQHEAEMRLMRGELPDKGDT